MLKSAPSPPGLSCSQRDPAPRTGLLGAPFKASPAPIGRRALTYFAFIRIREDFMSFY